MFRSEGGSRLLGDRHSVYSLPPGRTESLRGPPNWAPGPDWRKHHQPAGDATGTKEVEDPRPGADLVVPRGSAPEKREARE